jgi:hypothetical protein
MACSFRVLDIGTVAVVGLRNLRGTIDAVDGAPIPVQRIATATAQETEDKQTESERAEAHIQWC